jgi:predicted transposase YdaD
LPTGNGATYTQNYDIIVKWMAAALQGQTLKVFGLETGRIQEVFGFEPVDLPVHAGRVDVMLRDEEGDLYHVEEQRNLTRDDMYRFAAYHFLAARQWGRNITDIVLASGKVYPGEKRIGTSSGKYTPIVIDFSRLDAQKRLAEIQREVQAGTYEDWLELVFLPLYGSETGTVRAEIVERIIRFETELCKAQKISSAVLAATLVMSNKLIDKDRIEALWEEIKMLDVLEVAKEKGIKEGMEKGLEEGMEKGLEEGMEKGFEKGKNIGGLDMIRQMLMDAVLEKFGVVPPRIPQSIRQIQDIDVLRGLFRQVFRCENLEAFEGMLGRLE